MDFRLPNPHDYPVEAGYFIHNIALRNLSKHYPD